MAENGRLGRSSARVKAAWARAEGATQEEAAACAAVSSSTLRRWERGNDAAYWSEWERARSELRRTLWARAWRRLGERLDSESERVQVMAARVIVSSVDGDQTRRFEVEHSGLATVRVYPVELPARLTVEQELALEKEEEST